MRLNINIHTSLLAAASTVILLGSCAKWTQPENLNFRHSFVEQDNKEAYEAYLNKIREYKKSDHRLMFLTMNGISGRPASQSQHIMAMPDSADYICVKVNGELNETIASEILQVREKKGTGCLLFVDYAPIHEAWGLLEDERSEKGLAPGTKEELIAFFKKQTEAQLSACNKYGFDGLMVTFLGKTSNEYAKNSHVAYMNAIKDFHKANSDKILVFRGTVRNVIDKEFLKEFKYLTVVAGEDPNLSVLVGRIFGREVAKDRVIMELSVPSADEPEQKGLSPIAAAKWLLTELENKDFKILGLGVSNASDDYFSKEGVFNNIRKAISIINPVTKTEE